MELLDWDGTSLVLKSAAIADPQDAVARVSSRLSVYCQTHRISPYRADLTGLLGVPFFLRVGGETLDAAVMARLLRDWRPLPVLLKGDGYVWAVAPAHWGDHRTTEDSVTFAVDDAGDVTYDPGEYLFAGGTRPPVYAAPSPARVDSIAERADTPVPVQVALRRVAAHMRGERPGGVTARI